MNAKRNFAVNIILAILISAGTILLAVFVYQSSYVRTIESLQDLFVSIKFYFCKIFGLDATISLGINEPSEAIVFGNLLPSNIDGFKAGVKAYFGLLFDAHNFVKYLDEVAHKIAGFSKISLIILPVIVALIVLVKMLYNSSNTKHNIDTVPLKIWKKMSNHSYLPIKTQIMSFIDFLKAHKYIYILWIIAWCFSLNFASILISALGYYFYFVVSFDMPSLYAQLKKLVVDLSVFFSRFPWWILTPFLLVLFDRFRKRIADDILRHKEAQNCGFINSLPIVEMTCGSMGKKKTTTMTDMALSQEVMFRQKAFELLQKNDMRFPYFPWISYEMELKKCMEYGTVFNLATCSEFVRKKKSRYEKHHDADLQLFGYDTEKYGLYYDDVLNNYYLFDVLETYAKLYFIYVIESSILVANYSIREDNLLQDAGNFPIWDTEFFPKRFRDKSHHAHILDFDTLRLGKKLVENNPKAGSFEFGVVVISEVGKERGNNLELKEVKKGTDETNQKNDLFNSWLKMCRHAATVENFPFIKVFTDEQRPESWGADARDLADIVYIVSSSEQKLALPFYTIGEMINDFLFSRFMKLYYDFRFRRGDNTLLVHILKTIVSKIYNHNSRIYNRYGYSTVLVETESGRMNGKKNRHKYSLMNAKIYRHVFSTDCFSNYFASLAKKTKVGINDYMEYATERATVEELKQQNSYFINSLYKSEKEVE